MTISFWYSDPEWVPDDEIRRVFNDGHYLEMLANGELIAILLKDRPAKPSSGQPHGTRSQILTYKSKTGKLVALVHQYLRPDGTLGASGLPDPKRLLHNNRLLAVRS